LGHIQSRCKILEKPRLAAHHMIWREILLQLFSLSGDEGDEHKWVIPSAVSADSHKELTVRERVLFIGTRFSNLYTSVDTPTRGRVVQVFQHFDFFASDAVFYFLFLQEQIKGIIIKTGSQPFLHNVQPWPSLMSVISRIQLLVWDGPGRVWLVPGGETWGVCGFQPPRL
jgi:hypothetical protein